MKMEAVYREIRKYGTGSQCISVCLSLISWAFEFDVTAGFNVRPAVFMPAWWR